MMGNDNSNESISKDIVDIGCVEAVAVISFREYIVVGLFYFTFNRLQNLYIPHISCILLSSHSKKIFSVAKKTLDKYFFLEYYVSNYSHEGVMLTKKSTKVRKEEIVQAALEVIGKKGVGALTIAAIAETVGMCEANIYRHFDGKDDINLAIVDFIGVAVMGKASTIAAGSRKPLEKLETIFFSHIKLISEHPGLPRFIFSEDVRLGNQKLAENISFRLGSYVETLAGIIAAGINEGDLRHGLSPRETALTFLGMVQSTALRWAIGSESFDINVEAKKLWSNFVQLVC
jgi:AcrR family transcriptional regulator